MSTESMQKDIQYWVSTGLSPQEAAGKAVMFKAPDGWGQGDPNPNFAETPYYNPNAFNFGGDPNAAANWSNDALQRSKYQDESDDWYRNAAVDAQGRLVTENAQLAGNEGLSRGEQQGATDLARDAAMGNAPSEAAYLMQHGLNQGVAQQQSQMASARGAGALANAQGNASANIAAMQNNTYTQAGALRAQEMAQARGMYGSLAGQMRGADQARLGQSNQMAQFNRQANDQYSLGLGNLAGDRAKLAQNYWTGGADITAQQGAAMRTGQEILERSHESEQGLTQRGWIANTDQANRSYDEARDAGYAVGSSFGNAAMRSQPTGMSGSKPPP